METNNKTLDYVKAFTDTDRLRIVGVLSRHSASIKDISTELNIPFKDAYNHLEFMKFLGAVKEKDGYYELDAKGMEELSHRQLQTQPIERYTPAQGLDESARKVLKNNLNPDGSIRHIPAQQSRLKIILDYLLEAFTPGVNYTEKEVNTILRRYHEDTAFLRRALVDAGMLMRESDCSRYWRPEVKND